MSSQQSNPSNTTINIHTALSSPTSFTQRDFSHFGPPRDSCASSVPSVISQHQQSNKSSSADCQSAGIMFWRRSEVVGHLKSRSRCARARRPSGSSKCDLKQRRDGEDRTEHRFNFCPHTGHLGNKHNEKLPVFGFTFPLISRFRWQKQRKQSNQSLKNWIINK